MCYYPKRIFLDDLFLFRVGSGGEKENGEKNRRAFALGKGGGADAFASCRGKSRGKSRGKGVCAVPVPLVLLGDVWGERRCWSTEEGKTEKTATSATARERLFTA